MAFPSLSAGHQARHLGLLWITTEAATLATVPLLHFNGTPRAFEATWKYLLIGGTGIALSLLGSFCLGYASFYGGGSGDLTFAALVAQGAGLSRPWVLIAWVLVLVGYGTKMGLAPMHTWKPDAYGEAPGIVGAILAGGVTTVAFTAILRVRAVVEAAGEGGVASTTMLAIGALFDADSGAPPPCDTRLQADARLFKRGAHGDPCDRRRTRPGRRMGGPLSCLEQQPDKGIALPERGQHSARRGGAHRRRSLRHVRHHAALGGPFCRGRITPAAGHCASPQFSLRCRKRSSRNHPPLGRPGTTPAGGPGWPNITRNSIEALMAVALARRRTMFDALDGQFGKAAYALAQPAAECMSNWRRCQKLPMTH